MITSKYPMDSLLAITFAANCTEELSDILKKYIKTMPYIGTRLIYHFNTCSIPCYVVSANKYATKIVHKLYFDNYTPLIREEFYYAYQDAYFYYFTRNGKYSARKKEDSFIKIHKENYDRFLLHA